MLDKLHIDKLAGSGVLAIVVFGLTLAHNKSRMNADTVREAVHLWEFLGYWGNCIIFILAGYTVGSAMTRKLKTMESLAIGLLLYPAGLCARTLFMGR